MAVVVTSSARDYDASYPYRRYVRYDEGGSYRWCEKRPRDLYDTRQGTCTVDDLPFDVSVRAIEAAGTYPSYVEWPL